MQGVLLSVGAHLRLCASAKEEGSRVGNSSSNSSNSSNSGSSSGVQFVPQYRRRDAKFGQLDWCDGMPCHAIMATGLMLLYKLPLKVFGVLVFRSMPTLLPHTAAEETLFLSSKPSNYYTIQFNSLKTNLHPPTMQQTTALKRTGGQRLVGWLVNQKPWRVW
jgi:hypothetical protein